MSQQEHWNGVYERNESDRLSWFQAEPAVSLELIRSVGLRTDT